MQKTFAFTMSLFITAICFSQPKEYYLKASFGISNTFFSLANIPDGINLGEPYAKKGPIGSFFNIELQIKKKNGLIYEYGFSQYLYQKEVSISYGTDINTTYATAALYHRTHFFHFAINKPFILKNNDFISVGLGTSFAYYRNQFFTAYNGGRSFILSEARTLDLGSQLQVRYEKELKNKIRCGVEAKLITLIIPFGINDLSVGPYVRLKF